MLICRLALTPVVDGALLLSRGTGVIFQVLPMACITHYTFERRITVLPLSFVSIFLPCLLSFTLSSNVDLFSIRVSPYLPIPDL